MTAFELVRAVRDSAGIAHKTDIRQACAALAGLPPLPAPVGDDCAAIPDGDGYLLFAIEGMLESFVSAEPWFAGYCAVMVNISDVAAMGGRPIAIVDAIWSRDAAGAAAVWAGMQAASRAYGVPIVGGHTNARSAQGYLAAAVLGRATRLLTSFDARPGDVLLAAIDLRGAYFATYPYWNCSTAAPAERLRGDIALLAEIAEAGLCRAAKDISMGGVLGTLTMLAESSAAGACIDPGALPAPPGVPLERWLLSFPSFGYLLSVRAADADAVCARFAARSIACAPVGTVDDSHLVRIRHAGEEAVFWDLATEPFTGASAHVRT